MVPAMPAQHRPEPTGRRADFGFRSVPEDHKVSLVRAQRDEVVAAFELKESVGILTARQLQLPVTIYDPTAYYNRVRMKLFGGDMPGGKN